MVCTVHSTSMQRREREGAKIEREIEAKREKEGGGEREEEMRVSIPFQLNLNSICRVSTNNLNICSFNFRLIRMKNVAVRSHGERTRPKCGLYASMTS